MNEIITKLNEIEEKADAIIADAESGKERLLAELSEDERSIDEKYARMETEFAEQIRQEESRKAEEKLAAEEAAAKKKLAGIAERFARDKDMLVEEIFLKLTS